MATIDQIGTLTGGSGSTLAAAPTGSTTVAALPGRGYVWIDGELAHTLDLPRYRGGPIGFADGTALLGGHRVDPASGTVETTALTVELLISGLPFEQRHAPRFHRMGPSAAAAAGQRLVATHQFAPSKGLGDDEANRGPDAQIVLVDPIGGTLIAVLEDYEDLCVVAAHGAFVAAATGQVSVWNADDGSPIAASGLDGFALDLRLTDDRLALALSSGAVEVRSFEALDRPTRADRAHPGGTTAVAFHPHLPILASGGRDQQVKLWSTDAGDLAEIASFDASAKVGALAFSADGDQLLVATPKEVLVTELSGL